jgi:hypothetical protein
MNSFHVLWNGRGGKKKKKKKKNALTKVCGKQKFATQLPCGSAMDIVYH